MFRFSLASFLIAVAFISLVFAAFAHPNEYWMQIVATSTIGLLFASTVTAVAWRKSGRWFCFGFAVVGWGYLALAFYGGDTTRKVLLTHLAVTQLDRWLETTTPLKSPSGDDVMIDGKKVDLNWRQASFERLSLEEAEERGLLKYAYTPSTRPQIKHFRDIGHYTWAMILGCISGTLSLWLHRKSTETS